MMIILVLGLVVFLGVHSIRMVADDWRTKQIQRIGPLPWKAIFSLVSIAGFILIVWGFSIARRSPDFLWIPPVWMRHLMAALMLVAFILLAAAYVPGNRIKARFGHPMILAVKTWALAHLLANGRLADLILFGAFLVWAIADFAVARRRDRLTNTSYPVMGARRDVATILIGVIAFGLFAHYGHEMLIGVRPFG